MYASDMYICECLFAPLCSHAGYHEPYINNIILISAFCARLYTGLSECTSGQDAEDNASAELGNVLHLFVVIVEFMYTWSDHLEDQTDISTVPLGTEDDRTCTVSGDFYTFVIYYGRFTCCVVMQRLQAQVLDPRRKQRQVTHEQVCSFVVIILYGLRYY